MESIKYLAALALAGCATTAVPGSLLGDKEACEHFGTVMVQVGSMREGGVPRELAETSFNQRLEEAKGNPDSYIKTEADVKFAQDSFKKVWESKLPAYLVAAEVYQACVARSA